MTELEMRFVQIERMLAGQEPEQQPLATDLRPGYGSGSRPVPF